MFQRLQLIFAENLVLKFTDPLKSYILTTDASQYAIGAMLSQLNDDAFHHLSQHLRAACQAKTHPATSPTTATLGPAVHPLIVPPAYTSTPQAPEKHPTASQGASTAIQSEHGSH